MLPDVKTFFQKKIIFALSLNFLLLLSLFVSARGAGEVDPGFNATIQRFAGEMGNSMAVQPDGKILVGGNFTLANGVARSAVARFNPDGTLDTSFDSGDLVGFTFGHIVNTIKVQPDGKILIAGTFTSIGGVARTNLARLNPNGSVDTSFANINVTGPVVDIEFLPDGKIILAGGMTVSGGVIHNRLSKLNANGTQDTTFNNIGSGPDIVDAAVTADGKIFIGGASFLQRYTSDGMFELFFTVNGNVLTILPLPNGQLIIGGSFAFYNGFAQGRIARINPDGSLDTSFNSGIGFSGIVVDTVLAPDGKIIAGGSFGGYNGVNRPRLARLNADGTLDTSFSFTHVEPNSNIVDIDVLSDGSVLALYSFFSPNTSTRRHVIKTLPNGALDTNFNIRFGTFGAAYKLFSQADGKVLVGGDYDMVNGVLKRGVFRLNADGSLDTTFNVNFTVIGGSFYPTIYDIARQPDGKYIIVGTGFALVNGHSTMTVARINPDGTTDTTFSSQLGGTARSVAIEPDGKILIGGSLTLTSTGPNAYLVRLNANGSVDNSFNPNIVDGVVYRVLKQPDGKILIGGNFFTVHGFQVRGIARLNANNSFDNTFNPGLGTNNAVFALALQADGKVLIGGAFTGFNGANRPYLARLNTNGSLDTGFTATPNSTVHDIVIQPNGKILAGGEFNVINNVSSSRYARLNPDGSVDTSFIVGSGANTFVFDIELQTDGKILLGGNFTRIQGQPRGSIARLLNSNTPRAIFDYNGDGISDLSVFRPSSGFWYIARPTGIPSQNFDAVQFGVSGDLPVPADYDGDGRTDVAVWRPSDGTWYLMQSTAGFRAAQFGANGDIPVPGDFDGDGKANLAVFRPSAGAWYIARPTGVPAQNFDTVPFGANGDKPIVGADFDGDGKADVAVFRPSDGNWYRINSSTGQFVGIHFGVAEDLPVTADYDGDGKTDLAVWRPSDGVWYRINSGTDTFTATQFGISSDRPSPADYDGDGKADLAVFRPSEGMWYIVRSSSGFSAAQFGASGDIPTPNSFIR